jgi:type VI secretion system FHA domain protein
MIVTLEVIGEQAAQLGAGRRKVFHAIGGTIGRLPDNDWVLPDPYVSGRHALVRYLNGRFFVEDTSTNGVFVNSPDSRLSRTQAHALKNGDVLYIDAYEIKVSIEKESAAEAESKDPLAALQGRVDRGNHPKPERREQPARPVRAPAPEIAPPPDDDRTASMASRAPKEDSADRSNETQWFGLSEMQLPDPSPEPPRPKVVAVRPPPVRRSEPKPAPAREAAPARSGDADDAGQMLKLLEAAGVTEVDPSDELARTCGEVLRVTVGGLMEVLRARDQMKDDLHIRSTTFKASNNNPLKFSANVEDAFHNLLVRQNAAYLEPTEAFAEALQDVRDHQTAVLAAMRLAFETMLAQFDPNRLQEEFDRHMKKGSILGVPAKLRYWDLYREKYGEMIKDADDSFRTLFGNAFAKAYEEQIERLKSRGRKR